MCRSRQCWTRRWARSRVGCGLGWRRCEWRWEIPRRWCNERGGLAHGPGAMWRERCSLRAWRAHRGGTRGVLRASRLVRCLPRGGGGAAGRGERAAGDRSTTERTGAAEAQRDGKRARGRAPRGRARPPHDRCHTHAHALCAEATPRGADASLHVSDGRAQLDVSGMPQTPPQRVYEVWVKRSGAPQPTDALFTVTAHGDATVGVPGSVRGVKVIMVTSEPLGGSKAPTTSPVIIARL